MQPKQKTERALIGTDTKGNPVVLATDGPTIGYDCAEVSTDANDIGLADRKDCLTPGLYLWEGTAAMEHVGDYESQEQQIVYTGTIRPVLPSEIAELYAMEPPDEMPPEDDRESIAPGDERYYRTPPD